MSFGPTCTPAEFNNCLVAFLRSCADMMPQYADRIRSSIQTVNASSMLMISGPMSTFISAITPYSNDILSTFDPATNTITLPEDRSLLINTLQTVGISQEELFSISDDVLKAIIGGVIELMSMVGIADISVLEQQRKEYIDGVLERDPTIMSGANFVENIVNNFTPEFLQKMLSGTTTGNDIADIVQKTAESSNIGALISEQQLEGLRNSDMNFFDKVVRFAAANVHQKVAANQTLEKSADILDFVTMENAKALIDFHQQVPEPREKVNAETQYLMQELIKMKNAAAGNSTEEN